MQEQEFYKCFKETPTVRSIEPLEATERIITDGNDYWGDTLMTTQKIPHALYYYYIDGNELSTSKVSSNVPPISAVVSLTYTPYIKKSDLDMTRVSYDNARYPENIDQGLTITTLNRIDKQSNSLTKLFDFKVYNPVGKTIGGARNWQNESKLWNFPYQYMILFDNLNDPLELKYHLIHSDTQGYASIMANAPISNGSTYSLYCRNYKGDTFGCLESRINNKSTQLPIVSSGYMDYMSQNKAQHSTKKENTIISGLMGVAGVAVSAAAGTAMGGPAMGALAATSSLVNTGLKVRETIAQERDLGSMPNALISSGSDTIFDITSNANLGLQLRRIGLDYYHMEKLGEYFAMYGYKQSRLMRPNIRDRWHYNYIKTISTNLKSNGIAKNHLEQLKAIYENGVTVWHVDREDVIIGDYSKDNVEV